MCTIGAQVGARVTVIAVVRVVGSTVCVVRVSGTIFAVGFIVRASLGAALRSFPAPGDCNMVFGNFNTIKADVKLAA